MSIRAEVQNIYNKIYEQAGCPPVYFVTESVFKQLTGIGMGANTDARCNYTHMIFCVKQNKTFTEIKDSIWHEILHLLYRNLPEWWIECAAYKLSGNYDICYGVHADLRNKTPRHNVPSKRLLLEMIQETSKEMRKWEK